MKRTQSNQRKLRLSRETLRELGRDRLERVAGGQLQKPPSACFSCTCDDPR